MSSRELGRPESAVDTKRLLEYERLGRFDEAARLAEELQLTKEAARLWERACEFERAVEKHIEAAEPDKALLLAARLGMPALIDRCIEAVAALPGRGEGTTVRLTVLGFFETAAQLHERLGDGAAAAALYERANRSFRAATLYQATGDQTATERNLRRAIRLGDDAGLASLALATSLERRGRLEAAASVLQRVPKTDPLFAHTLPPLARILARLELPGAARETLTRLGQLGATPSRPPSALRTFEVSGGIEGSRSDRAVLLGRYEVLDRSFRTASAQVYQAFDRVLLKTVAVKLFAPSLITDTGRDAFLRFEREVRVLRELEHPAIVPLVDYHPQGPALVLAWMAGGSLRDKLSRGSLTPQLGALVATRLLSALAAAHRRGILHRDIKPDNVLFDGQGIPYLADFGTAHIADHAQTVTHGLLGTLAYMAPPQRQGHPANVRSDIYSVGAVFWHVLTGAPPDQKRTLASHELSAEQRALATRLIDIEDLPDSASEAGALLERHSWPSKPLSTFEQEPSERPSIDTPQRLRIEGETAFDSVLQRAVHAIDADPEALERARSFAAADHPNLAAVLRFDPRQARIWLESLPTRTSSRLGSEHLQDLKAALIRLHAVGSCHGAIDPMHIGWRGQQPVLLFPMTTRHATLAEDLARLERLT